MDRDTALILVYGADGDDPRVRFLREGESYLNYALKLIGRDDTKKTIAELLDLPAAAVVETDPDAPSLLLFAGFPDKTVHLLLGALRDNQIRFDLKAVVTGTNRGWTLDRLLEDLRDEHAVMNAWQALAAMTQKADLLLMEPAVLLDTGGFEADVEAAKSFLRQESNEAITLDILIEKKKKIEDHLSRLGY